MNIFIPTIISRLFEPVVILGLLSIAGIVSQTNLPLTDAIGISMFFVFGIFLPPFLVLLYAVKKKWVKDIDVSDRRQRVWVLLSLVIFLLVDFFVERMLHVAFIDRLFEFFIVWFAGFFCITTLGWKISGHIGIGTIAILMLIHWFGPTMSLWFLVLPLIAWARLVLKKHTLSQIIGGFFYSFGVYFLVIRSGLL
jgi:membrane-associated phospholipid phosphatase